MIIEERLSVDELVIVEQIKALQERYRLEAAPLVKRLADIRNSKAPRIFIPKSDAEGLPPYYPEHE